jgi:hypothetical protein
MVGKLISFPLRVSVRGAQLWFRAAEEVAGRATLGALRVVSVFTRDGTRNQATAAPPQPRPRPQRRVSRDPRSQATAPAAPEPEPVSADDAAARIDRLPEQPPTQTPTPAPEPSHVSEEPQLVREEAAPDAAEGAGPGITVHEPWEGYSRMSAKDVIARLPGATPAELAAVSLYESGNRSRQTVLEAVQRQLRAANGGR